MDNRPLRGVVSGTVLAITLSGVCRAQGTDSASVAGTVVDPLRGPLAQVQVLVRDTANAVVATARTDSSGMFLVRGLARHARYLVMSRRIGYTADTVTVLMPQVRDTLRLDVKLRATTPKLDVVKVEARRDRPSGGFLRGLRAAYHAVLKHGLPCGGDSANTARTPGFHWDWTLNEGTSETVKALIQALCKADAQHEPSPP